jgi:signal recognition particle receptor subunit beta
VTWLEVPDPFDAECGTLPVKLVVAGGWGSGKTTFVGAISEIVPITTEAPMTSVAAEVDTGAVATKVATTVALDFGRISLDSGLVLYLFGLPGQARFRFAWERASRGAIGAVVLADSRRIADAFPSVDFCEAQGIPFVVAVNRFDGVLVHDLDAVRAALVLPEDVPVLDVDARTRADAKRTLISLVMHALRAGS